MSQAIPNRFPVLEPSTARLAIIGEAPSTDDELAGEPFVGAAGRLLRGCLANSGIAIDRCYVGNVCQIRPPDNDITNFDFHGPEISHGLDVLRSDLATFKPNCILALGRSPLRAFVPSIGHTSDDGSVDIPISNYRGSILSCETDVATPRGCKLVASYHPSYIMRQFSDLPLFKFDIARAAKQAKFPEIRYTPRNITIRPSLTDVTTYLSSVLDGHLSTSFDIEGYTDNIGVTMLSIAKSPTDCLVIPFYVDGKHYWSEDDEVVIWQLLGRWFFDAACKKTTQNGMYELFVLAWSHKCKISGIDDDTMFKQWETFPELEKGLGVIASIWTEEPYYKSERLSDNTDVKLLYNGKDSCITEEANRNLETQLIKEPKSYAHYRFNISLIPAVSYLSLRGCKFDHAAADYELRKTNEQISTLNTLINDSLGREFNPKSVKDKQWLLYTFFGYEPYKRYGQTTKEEVLLRYYAKHRHPILKQVIELVSLRTRRSDIGKLVTDPDGRIRSNFNLVGTNTGRISSSSSSARVAYFTKTGILKWDFTGTNLQNVTKDLRICFVPDNDQLAFWQCDLSGADGWTVGADLAALGHTTMLDDYLAGIKPAKVLLLMLDEYEAGRDPGTINRLDRSELRRLTKLLKFPDEHDSLGRPGDWKYLCMKRVQHGTNYDMEPDKLAATIFKDSEGTIDLTTKDAALYQYLYKLRYNPGARREYIKRTLADKGYLTSAAGIRRQFFGLRSRKDPEPEIIREALAFEPQANTTFAANLALRNLWFDEENRTPLNTLFIEPLLQIHDAMAGQFPRAAASWAMQKLHSYFDFSLTIHGIDVHIPFEGGYGANWKECKEVEFS